MTLETPEQPGAAPDPSAAPQTEPEARPDPSVILQSKLDEALRELGEAKLAARRAQSTSDANTRRLEREVSELRATMVDVQTRGMSPEEADTFRTKQALRAYENQQRQQQDLTQQMSAFEQEANAFLASKGISPEDPTLKGSFQRHAQEHNTPEGWRLALGLAIADLEAEKRQKVQEERQKLLDDLQVKQRNEARREAGPVDRGAPASAGGKRPSEMNDEEFQQHLSRLNSESRKRTGR